MRVCVWVCAGCVLQFKDVNSVPKICSSFLLLLNLFYGVSEMIYLEFPDELGLNKLSLVFEKLTMAYKRFSYIYAVPCLYLGPFFNAIRC